jgi:hypothetical protein
MDSQWWTLAHIVGMRPPGLLSWVAAIALFGGLLGVLFRRGRLRLAFVFLALAGLAGTIDDLYVRGLRPSRPDLLIQLASPGNRTTNPVVVQICAHTHSGAPETPTANGRYLLVRVDGAQVAEVHTSTLAIPVSRGVHIVSAEITSPDHQEFQPALKIERLVRVTGTGPPQPGSCPSR